ncbi:hypothetical protein E4U60_005809 [Claviceps pazoutovae]|uniref:Uncharacterized protein n=1 Tax=Claviceps pazoutovae TaxID=1649127 RepID=A0A9P7SEP1_9HYPO|nr:hypothetical protein E4U60_005809 [Claviceps pazoutovae]
MELFCARGRGKRQGIADEVLRPESGGRVVKVSSSSEAAAAPAAPAATGSSPKSGAFSLPVVHNSNAKLHGASSLAKIYRKFGKPVPADITDSQPPLEGDSSRETSREARARSHDSHRPSCPQPGYRGRPRVVKPVYTIKESCRKTKFYELLVSRPIQVVSSTADVRIHRKLQRLIASQMSESSLK